MSAPIQGVLLTRIQLRRAARGADTATQTAIGQALADPNFADDLTNSALNHDGINDVTALPTGWLQKLMAFLVANLPAILALIMTLFGGA